MISESLPALQAIRSRRACSMKISLAIALFFSLAWCLLQWSLVSGAMFEAAGVARDFAVIEARVCAAAAIAALLHLAGSAVAWAAAGLPSRRLPAAG